MIGRFVFYQFPNQFSYHRDYNLIDANNTRRFYRNLSCAEMADAVTSIASRESSKLYEDTSLVESCLFTSVNSRELSMDVIDETGVKPINRQLIANSFP